MGSQEILALIEQFETAYDTYWQVLQKHNEEVLSQLREAWKFMQAEQKEEDTIKDRLSSQNSELTELRTKSEELDKTMEGLNTKKDEFTSKISELTNTLETSVNDLKKPGFEFTQLEDKLSSVNEKIISKEEQKTVLDQKTVENENREIELKNSYQKKMDDLESARQLRLADLIKYQKAIVDNNITLTPQQQSILDAYKKELSFTTKKLVKILVNKNKPGKTVGIFDNQGNAIGLIN